MCDLLRGALCALDVRILRFIYEHGPSSIADFYERSGFQVEGRSHDSALDGFHEAVRKGLIVAVETSPGSELRYHPLMEVRKLRALLVRNAVKTALAAQTEGFREVMAEFAKLPRR